MKINHQQICFCRETHLIFWRGPSDPHIDQEWMSGKSLIMILQYKRRNYTDASVFHAMPKYPEQEFRDRN